MAFLGAGCSRVEQTTIDPALIQLQEEVSELKSAKLKRVEEFEQGKEEKETVVRELEATQVRLQQEIASLENQLAELEAGNKAIVSTESPEIYLDSIALTNGHRFMADVTSIEGDVVHIRMRDKTQTGQLSAVSSIEFRVDPAE
jgi:hypothetical protein